MIEEWRPTHHPNYEVSNLGRVRAWVGPGTKVGRVRLTCPRILRAGKNSAGYPMVVFYPEVTGHMVHRLVAAAFICPCPPGHEVMHRDDNRSNARLDNLSYGTHLENVRDAVAKGRIVCGEEHHFAGITEAQALGIKRALDARRVGRSQSVRRGGLHEVAAQFGVPHSTVRHISQGRSWKHVRAA